MVQGAKDWQSLWRIAEARHNCEMILLLPATTFSVNPVVQLVLSKTLALNSTGICGHFISSSEIFQRATRVVGKLQMLSGTNWATVPRHLPQQRRAQSAAHLTRKRACRGACMSQPSSSPMHSLVEEKASSQSPQRVSHHYQGT
jgi:hypothetical protein